MAKNGKENSGLSSGMNKAQNLMERMLKFSRIDKAERLEDSIILNEQMGPPTKIKLLNVAWSGSMEHGPGAGITTIAGRSKHYKSTYASHAMAGFLNKYEDGLVLYYNNEFGIKRSYLENCGVDISRICHIPFTSIESLIEDIVYKLENLTDKDKVIVVIDSISNSSTQKEYTDALEQTGKNDMTKAKKVKSLMRLITPTLYMKNIPLIQICHTYLTQDLFAKTVINGGESIILNSDTIFLVSKSSLKESSNKEGFSFDLKIIKSRFIKEDSIVHILVRWDSGISIYSGFAELATEFGIIKETGSTKKKTYTYESINKGVVEVPAKKIDINKDFWELILAETDLQYRIESFYKLPVQKSIDQIELDVDQDEDDED